MSQYAYIAYYWIPIYTQRRLQLNNDLPEAVPPSVNALRQEILGFVDGNDESAQGFGEVALYNVQYWLLRA